MENTILVQWVMAAGTSVAALGSVIAACLSWRSVRRQELRDVPKASVLKRFDDSLGTWTILVSNVGHVAFTVVDARIGAQAPVARFGVTGEEACIAHTVQPGGHAVIRFGAIDASGTARIRLADGSEFDESLSERKRANS